MIWLNLGLRQLANAMELGLHLNQQLATNQELLGVDRADESPAEYLCKLIEKAHHRYGRRVVMLVDEYDKHPSPHP